MMEPEAPKPGHGDQADRDGEGQKRGADLDELGRPFVLDQADVRRSGKAYPGTVVVYTAAKLQNLDPADAKKVALFIRTATTEGQKEGAGNGRLPAGFVPLQASGGTKKLFDVAQEVADAVEAQTPEPTGAPSSSATGAPTLPPNSGDAGTGDAPGGDVVPTEAAGPSAVPSATAPAEPIDMPETRAVSSDLGNRAVPLLLICGLIGIALTSAVRFFVRPPRRPLP
jgi:hypothetical protein